MKKIIIAVLVLAFIMYAGTACTTANSDLHVALQDDEVRFGMSVKQLKSIKGTPVDVVSDYCDTSSTAYLYYENVQGLNTETTYIFEDNLLNSSLYEVCYLFDPRDYDNALNVAKCIYDNVKDEYEKEDGFFEESFAEENDGFYASLGIKNGAIGVSIIIDCDEGHLSVSSINQQ